MWKMNAIVMIAILVQSVRIVIVLVVENNWFHVAIASQKSQQQVIMG